MIQMIQVIAAEITQTQLLIAGLLSGTGVVGLIVRWLVSSPEREAAAYKAGVADEATRCAEDIRDLRKHALEQAGEIKKLRDGLLRLAVASDLTPAQRREIAEALGYDVMLKGPLPPKPPDPPVGMTAGE